MIQDLYFVSSLQPYLAKSSSPMMIVTFTTSSSFTWSPLFLRQQNSLKKTLSFRHPPRPGCKSSSWWHYEINLEDLKSGDPFDNCFACNKIRRLSYTFVVCSTHVSNKMMLGELKGPKSISMSNVCPRFLSFLSSDNRNHLTLST